MKKTILFTAICAMSVGLTGCFSSSSSSGSDTSTEGPSTEEPTNSMTSTTELEGEQQGEIIDSPVKGLPYWTASHGHGTTDEQGQFNFMPGEMVVFFLGDSVLMHTDAELITTPMDTLTLSSISKPGEGHPHEPLNILRLLQSIDEAPNDENVIVVPDTWADSGSSFTMSHPEHGDTGLEFSRPSDEFVRSEFQQNGSAKIVDPDFFVDRDVAQQHLENSLRQLETTIDLRGEWDGFGTGGSGFGANDFGDIVSSETLEVGDDVAFFRGEEPHSVYINGETFFFKAPLPVSDDDIRPDSEAVKAIEDQVPGWGYHGEDGIEERLTEIKEWDEDQVVTRDDGENWIEMPIEPDSFFFDGKCESANCDLAGLRSTTDDWDQACLHNDFNFDNPNNPWNGDLDPEQVEINDYCLESDDHNGPVIGYSEVSYADRLGGDRIIRLKRDFWFSGGAPGDVLDSADEQLPAEGFEDQQHFYTVSDRREAVEHRVDLTEGSWTLQRVTPDNREHGDTVIEGVEFTSSGSNHPEDVAVGCDDYSACSWRELNDSEDIDRHYVRGTDVINWVSTNGDLNTLSRD